MKNLMFATAAVAAQDACACLKADSLPSPEYWDSYGYSKAHGEGCGAWDMEYPKCKGAEEGDCLEQWCYVSLDCESGVPEDELDE